MAFDLYCARPSPSCRGVLLALKSLEIDANINEVNLKNRENESDEFAEMNPRKCVPTLVDGDFKLWDSHAILMYLANKYNEGGDFYPQDPVERAKVDYMLFFNVGDLSSRFSSYWVPIAFKGESADEEKLAKVLESTALLNTMIGENPFVAGENITIADFSLISTVSSMTAVGIDISEYENVENWATRCSEQMVDYEEENGAGAEMFGNFIKGKMEGGD